MKVNQQNQKNLLCKALEIFYTDKHLTIRGGVLNQFRGNEKIGTAVMINLDNKHLSFCRECR